MNDEEIITVTVTEVRYSRLAKIKGVTFENERAEIAISLTEGDSVDLALLKAKAIVNHFLGLGPTKDEVENARRILSEAQVAC
jgi:hypothetical protein